MDIEMSLNKSDVKLSWFEYLKGLSAVTLAYIAVRCFSLARIFQILNAAKSRCAREITIEEANQIWEIVRQQDFLFGRVACLEFSLAFVILALTQGCSTCLCVGVATEPFRAHSWVEVDGKPFRESESFIQPFRKLLAL